MRSDVVGPGSTSAAERRGVAQSQANDYFTYSASAPPAVPYTSSHANASHEHNRISSAPVRPPTTTPSEESAPVDGWFVLFLLAIAVYSVTVSIIAAKWVPHSIVLLCSPAVGLLLGMVVAKVPHPPQSLLHLTACLLGHWLAVVLTSVVAFHVSWFTVLTSLRAVIMGGLNNVGVPNGEEMIFFFYLCFLCFFLGYFGSWLVYRARLPWLVAFVYCSIMLVNLNYVKQDLLLVLLVLVCSLLLLIARVQLTAQVMQWKREGLRTDKVWLRGISVRCFQGASLLTVMILLSSPLLPIMSQPQSGVSFWNGLNNAWTNILNGHVSLQNPGSILQTYEPPTDFFGDQLSIVGSVHLPTGQVLTYISKSGPQYLEGFTYNQFDGHTWTSSVDAQGNPNMQEYGPDELQQQDVMRSDVSQISTTVTVTHPPLETKYYIFGPAHPVSFDVATVVYSDGTATAWTQKDPLVIGEQYRVVSSKLPDDPKLYSNIPLPLQDAQYWSNDPNHDLYGSYLRLPNDLSPKVAQTLNSWTSGLTDTYSVLKAIESHLNNQNMFTYSVENTPVPGNVDAVDWLLQTRKGYCTYYATAMSIMARMLDIPTRVVNGFSQGHYDAVHKEWVVNGDDAHSWVQAYLPGFGWVNFDPTPGFAPTLLHGNPTPPPTATKAPTQPVPTRTPTNKKPVLPPSHNTPPFVGPGNSHVNTSFLLTFSITTLVLSLLFLLVAVASYWWRTLYANSTFVAGMFWRISYLARFAGVAPKAWQTPYEYVQTLSRRIPQHANLLYHLAHLFVRERWGTPQQAPHPKEIEATQKMRPHLWQMLGDLLLRRRGM